MRRTHKKTANRVVAIANIAMAQTLIELRRIVEEGERLALQQLQHPDSDLTHRISEHMLGAAAVLKRLPKESEVI